MQLLERLGSIIDVVVLEVGDERDATDADTGPKRHGAVAMLSHNVAVDILCVDVQAIRQEPAQARGVEVGAGADDAVGRQSGELVCDVREGVDRVGDDEQRGVGAVLHQLGDDLLEEGHIVLDEHEPRLALALPCSRRHDADVGVGCDLVICVGENFRAG